jgi:NAD(P) transhydrogenase subunit alpha
MSGSLVTDVTMFVLAVLVGFEVISKVPATLHTPLMSGANSIHGIILLGVVIVAGSARTPLEYVLVAVAAAFATANVVGG